MNNNFAFTLKNNKKFDLPKKMEILVKLPLPISNTLINFGKYFVQTEVEDDIFQSFLDYLLNEKEPLINFDNFYQYFLLCNEFPMISNFVFKKEFDDLIKISYLKNSSSINKDKSFSEQYIAKNLDYYLDKYSKEMNSIPITSLYNIFNHKEMKLNNIENAYKFITEDKNNSSLFILLENLDSRYLSRENLNEALIKKDDHLGFVPKNIYSLITEINQIKIRVLYVTVKNRGVIDFNFVDQLNNQSSFYKILINKVFIDEIEQIANQLNYFLSLFDIILIGGCDAFAKFINGITQNFVENHLKQFKSNNGIILFLHNAYSTTKETKQMFLPLYSLLETDGKFKFDDINFFENLQFNDDCKQFEILSTPFNIYKPINIAKTHQSNHHNSEYAVLYFKTKDYQYYSENLNENIANLEMGHKIDITEQEKKLFFNIICHL